ncbi:MAG: hypothetical protein IKM08_02080, partial [Clostridia bacterium]|nr:hypothetical protein [Clostridia bacterium]
PQRFYTGGANYGQEQQYYARSQEGPTPNQERPVTPGKRLLGYDVDGYAVYLNDGEDLADKDKQVAFRLDGTASEQNKKDNG